MEMKMKKKFRGFRRLEKKLGKLGKKRISARKLERGFKPAGVKLKKVKKKYLSNLFVK